MIAVIVGTRPEVVKMAPVVTAMLRSALPFIFVDAGQHYDYALSGQFIHELKLPKPDVRMKIHARSPAEKTAKMMILVDRFLARQHPRLVLIQGDTNAMLASALAAFKQGIAVAHIEAGLRSYDQRMPEEHNRRMVDHASSYLFAPTTLARKNLESEKVPGKIYVVGNTVIDAVLTYMPQAEARSRIIQKLNFDRYLLATFHRAENVDDRKVLTTLVRALENAPIPVVFAVHPRTRERLLRFSLYHSLERSTNVQLLPAVGYFDFLLLMKNCVAIVTDSGGLQEEATAPGVCKPTVVVRKSTERPEAVKAGFSFVAGVDYPDIMRSLRRVLNIKPLGSIKSPFGDGNAAYRIVEILMEIVR